MTVSGKNNQPISGCHPSQVPSEEDVETEPILQPPEDSEDSLQRVVERLQREIAERQRVEAELRRSQQRLERIIHHIPIPIMEWNDRFEVLEWNPAAERVFGFTKAEILGRRLDVLVPEANRPPADAVITDWLDYRGGSQVVNENRRRDGRPILCEWHNALVMEGETAIGAVSMAIDVTERIQTEEALRESEMTNRLLLKAIPDLLMRVNKDGICVDYTLAKNFVNLREDLNWRGKHLCELMPPDMVEQRLGAVQKALETGQTQTYQQVVRVGDRVQHEEVRVVAFEQREALVLVQDITERKAAEEALRSSQQLLRLVMDAVPQHIFWKDRNSVYLGCNRNFARVAALSSPDEVVGKTDYDFPWTREESDWFRELDRRVIESNTPIYRVIEPQTYSDGTQRWSETNKVPLHDEQGQVIGILGTFEDVTERLVAEESLRQSESQLRAKAQELEIALSELQRTQSQLIQGEKMSSLGQLVAGVAHEINNPVSFIYGNIKPASEYIQDLLHLIHLYQEHYPEPAIAIQNEIKAIDLDFLRADLPKLLTSLRMGADRIRQIVLSLRTFSRMDEADMKEVDIHSGIDSTLMILQSRLKANHHRPDVAVIQSYGDLPDVECYAGQLNQVFMNILVNAIDALDERDEQRSLEENRQLPSTIEVRTQVVDQNWVSIQISDNGPGIPTDIRQRLFDPFFTTKPVGKGTGMGLSISYQIVTEKHGGTLHCFSEPGQGTTFVITIPVRQSVTA